jgi:hypothetical protein
MMEFYKGSIPIIEPASSEGRDLLHPKDATYGYVPRDYREYPEEMFAPPSELTTIPQSEWDARYDEQEESESSLEHIFLQGESPAFVNLDQNGDGHCWAYSTGHALMLSRLRDNRPLKRLNPHFVATYLKRFNGGWCGASAKVAAEVGYLEEGSGPDQWPLHSNNAGLLNQTRLDAAKKYKSTEEWRDLTRQIYDQSMTSLQLATCGFMNVPAPSDFNWWGHSVCQVRWVRIERGSWGPLILNSWKGWGRFGLGVLRGSQATANGAVAIRSATPTG